MFDSESIDKCRLVIGKQWMCLINEQHKEYMLEDNAGQGINVTLSHRLERSLAVCTINTLITVMCDNHAEMLMTARL